MTFAWSVLAIQMHFRLSHMNTIYIHWLATQNN